MRVETDGGGVIDLGTTETTPTIGITDYSRRVTDDFGVTTVVERGFSRSMSVRLAVPFDGVDALQRCLADLRATPARWVADDRFGWLAVRGFYKDFEVDLSVPPVSYCTLTIEGLVASEVVADPGGDPAADNHTSTLQMLAPVVVDGDMLTSSNVAEADYAEWSAAATYALGARVILAATHRIYESAIGGNIGHDPATGTGQWLDVGATNRWAMFDQALGSATTGSGSIAVTIAPGAAIDAVAVLDVVGSTVRVQASGYDQTRSVVGLTSATFLDLPLVAGNVSVTVAGSGTVSAGTLLIGRRMPLGVTEASPTAGITDYSRKDVDDFGEVAVVQRAWAKRMTVNALIRTDAVDIVANRIAAVRARPSLWIGQAGLDSLTIYGFFKDFSIEVGEAASKLSLSIEGLSAAAKVEPLTASTAWPDVTDPDGTKPENNATVGAPSGTPVGSSTADAVVDDIAAAQAAIDSAQAALTAIQAAIDSTDLGDTGAANAAKAAAEAARDAAQTARDTAQAAANAAAGARDAATTAQGLAIDAKNLASGYAATAGGSASAAAGSASTAATAASAAGSSATSATGAANIATSKAADAATSATGAATSASGAASSASGAGTSASAASQSKVSAQLGAAQTFPSGFTPAEQPYWIFDEQADPADATVGYDATWFGPASYPVFVSRAGQTNVLATRGLFVPVVGRRYRVALEVAHATPAGTGTASGYYGFCQRFADGSYGVTHSAFVDMGALPFGVWTTLTYDWLCAEGLISARPRFHMNWDDGTGAALSSHVFYVRSFRFEDVTAAEAAAQSASAVAVSMSSAAAAQTAAGNSASAANTSATNAATSASAAADQAVSAYGQAVNALTFASQASTSAAAASVSASDASGSSSTAAASATQAASARDAAGGSAAASASSASVASGKADAAGSSATAAASSALSASGSSSSAATQAGNAAAQSAVASAAAAAAQSSAVLSASVGTGSLAVNPVMADFADPDAAPGGWSFWGDVDAHSRRTPGRFGPYAFRQGTGDGVGSVSVNTGFYQNYTTSPGLRGQGTVWLVLEATITKVDGDLHGAGLYVPADGGGSASLDFAGTPTIGGAAPGSGDDGATYSWSRLVQVDTGAGLTLHALTGWSGFSTSAVYKTLDWHKASVRLASAQEVLAGVADTNATVALAQIGTEASVRASADSVLASTQATLTAQLAGTDANVTTALAQIGTEASTRATADAALASTQTTLTAQLAGTSGSGLKSTIDSNAAAAVSATAAVASRTSALEVTAGELDARTSIAEGAIVDLKGVTQAYVDLVAAAGDSVARISLVATKSNGTRYSRILLDADEVDIDGSLVLNGTVTGGKIAPNAVHSGNVSDFAGASTSGLLSGWQTIATLNITVAAGDILLFVAGGTERVVLNASSGGITSLKSDIRIMRDGSATVRSPYNYIDKDADTSSGSVTTFTLDGTYSITDTDMPGAGTFTYTLQISATNIGGTGHTTEASGNALDGTFAAIILKATGG